MRRLIPILITVFIFLIATVAYLVGQHDGAHNKNTSLIANVYAAKTSKPTPQSKNYSRTGAVKNRTVYYPGTEDLKPDEMRVIAYG